MPKSFLQCNANVSELQGRAASSGLALGTARILMKAKEADRLARGEVLIVQSLGPAWTPLIARAAAVVSETGGALASGASIAREYGIPAVLGVVDATRLIRDGQLVEVDGDAGVVRLISE